MWNHRLFQTTRGKVLFLLKKQGPCTVAYLSKELELTANAIRQHLTALERDNLVTQEQPVKNGPRKPAFSYSLTSLAESIFPKGYERLLASLMHDLLERDGPTGLSGALARAGCSIAERFTSRVSHLPVGDRVAEVARIMEETGSIIEWLPSDQGGLVLRDFNCPYAAVAGIHPEVCQVQRNFLSCLLAPATVQVDSIHHETNRCEFQVTLTPEMSRPA